MMNNKKKKVIAINTPAKPRATYSFNMINWMLAKIKKMYTKVNSPVGLEFVNSISVEG